MHSDRGGSKGESKGTKWAYSPQGEQEQEQQQQEPQCDILLMDGDPHSDLSFRPSSINVFLSRCRQAG